MIKSQLKKISSLLQLLSLETLQEIIKSMRLMNYKNLKLDFAQLSMMHGQKCFKILDNMDVEEEIKDKMKSHIKEFSDELIVTTDLESEYKKAYC
jgi:hypothetical protein